VSLVMSERQGIEIDYCPQCRGVWLDRGELDKIIERSVGANAAPQGQVHSANYSQRPSSPPPHSPSSHQSHGGYQQSGYYQKKKKESFLSDLFDF
ncbi:MAG TPA: zf-TFIIB domain-containing protein, partial [Cellvibrio sp.]|nr:zf-TFIIB domain-containing protein [Cellvibrio sp.]